MATFEEIALRFARQIQMSLNQDGFGKRQNLTESTVRVSVTASTLREIADELDRLTYEETGRFLSEHDKTQLCVLVAEQLVADNNYAVRTAVRAARNDDFAILVDIVSQIIQGK